MIDQEEAFKHYKDKVLSEAKGKYSDDMLAAKEEELKGLHQLGAAGRLLDGK